MESHHASYESREAFVSESAYSHFTAAASHPNSIVFSPSAMNLRLFSSVILDSPLSSKYRSKKQPRGKEEMAEMAKHVSEVEP
jgi:hypothetical protein